MRISDWSSDVCSSDLAEQIGRTEQLSAKKAPSYRCPGIFHARCIRAGLAGTGAQDKRGGDRACVGLFVIREVMRSEEHTSELQSLMRISYAAFCVTKTIR